MDRHFASWNRALADLIGAAGTPAFLPHLEPALKCLVDFDILMVFAYRTGERPACLHHNMGSAAGLDRAATVIDAYVAGPYLLDPFHSAAMDGSPEGVRRLSEMAPDRFNKSEYYRQHYGRTGIRDEVGFLCRPASWRGLVISLTRPVTEPAFSRRDMNAAHAAAPMIAAACAAHFDRLNGSLPPAAPGAPAAHDTIDDTLNRMTDGILTRREIEITGLILKGHSSQSIAMQLNITEGTVKIHRKNLYQKLEISSQSELFARFIRHLSPPR